MAERFDTFPRDRGFPTQQLDYAEGNHLVVHPPASDGEVTLLTTHDSVRQALRDPRFSRAAVSPDVHGFTGTAFMSVLGLLRLDAPDVRKIHTALGHLFFSDEIEKYTPSIREIALTLAEPLKEQSHVYDLNTTYFEPFLAKALSLTLGIPEEEWPKLKDFTDRTLALAETPHDITAIQAAWDELYGYTRDLIAAKRKHRDGSMISDAIHILTNTGMDEEMLLYVTTTILNAYPTPLPVMSVIAVELLQNPTIVQACLDNPSLFKPTLEELMRYKAHFAYVQPRAALEDVQVEGKTIHKGEVVLPSITAATHDPSYFSHPEKIDVTRRGNRHTIVFGAGPHYCLGAALTMQWLEIAFQTLFEQNPTLHLAIDPSDLTWQRGVLSTPESIPVTNKTQVLLT